MPGKTALVILAQEAEEMEAVIVTDILRRAQVNVTVASLDDAPDRVVDCSRQVKIMADCTLQEALDQTFDVIVLPGGGKGAENLAGSELVKAILEKHEKAGT